MVQALVRKMLLAVPNVEPRGAVRCIPILTNTSPRRSSSISIAGRCNPISSCAFTTQRLLVVEMFHISQRMVDMNQLSLNHTQLSVREACHVAN